MHLIEGCDRAEPAHMVIREGLFRRPEPLLGRLTGEAELAADRRPAVPDCARGPDGLFPPTPGSAVSRRRRRDADDLVELPAARARLRRLGAALDLDRGKALAGKVGTQPSGRVGPGAVRVGPRS